jgi:hypothetical protein
MNTYRLSHVHPLARQVHSIWRMNGTTDGRRETVLPHCKVDLLFNLAAPLWLIHRSPAVSTVAAMMYVAGAQTHAVETSSSVGGVALHRLSPTQPGCLACPAGIFDGATPISATTSSRLRA